MIEADVCVVGSGAGGGVIAGELAGAGKQVCVLEMGGYFNEADFDQLELPGLPEPLPERGGRSRRAEGQVSIQAGSALGGGTVINWTELPAHPPVGARGVGARATGSRASTAPTTTATSTRCWSASEPTTRAAT